MFDYFYNFKFYWDRRINIMKMVKKVRIFKDMKEITCHFKMLWYTFQNMNNKDKLQNNHEMCTFVTHFNL